MFIVTEYAALTFNDIDASLQKLLISNQKRGKTQSKKCHNSVKILSMITKF